MKKMLWLIISLAVLIFLASENQLRAEYVGPMPKNLERLNPALIYDYTPEELARWPQSFNPEELKKVREFEKELVKLAQAKNWGTMKRGEDTWVKVDYRNLDEVEALAKKIVSPDLCWPPSSKPQIKNWKDYVREPFYCWVVPYDRLLPTKGYLKISAENAGKSKIHPETGAILNHQGGLPFFPFPRTGTEAAFNHERGAWGDDLFSPGYQLIESDPKKQRVERILVNEIAKVFFKGRGQVPPVPEYPKELNPEGIFFLQNLIFWKPQEIAGLMLLLRRYEDPAKDDDSWLYVPAMRRFRRMSSAQRGDSAAGSDVTWDDWDTFMGKIDRFKWENFHSAIVFGSNDQDASLWTLNKGDLYFAGPQVQLRKMWVTESIPRDPSYVYGKKIMWCDQESGMALLSTMYDSKGRYWKLHDMYVDVMPRKEGYPYSGGGVYAAGGTGFDETRKHGLSHIAAPWSNLGPDINSFSLDALQKRVH